MEKLKCRYSLFYQIFKFCSINRLIWIKTLHTLGSSCSRRSGSPSNESSQTNKRQGNSVEYSLPFLLQENGVHTGNTHDKETNILQKSQLEQQAS